MKKVTRVLEVFDSLERSGGVQAVVMNMFRIMDKKRVIMDFAVYQDPIENSYREEILSSGSEVIHVKNPSSCGLIRYYCQFVALFRSKHYDAVHAHNIHHNGLILLAAKNAGVPIRISHSHQAYDERNITIPRKMMVIVLQAINNRVATRRIACSDLAGKFLYRNKDYEFIPNAINLEKFNISESKAELRKKYGFKENQMILIHIGRFSPQKNQFFLIDIMNFLREEDCILLMIGDGSLRDDFYKSVYKCGLNEKIKCLGLRQDVGQLLKLSDCMLLPSIYEGLPVVAVEAQAVGCYSIISDKVTRQADLGLGLIEYESIEDAKLWADTIKSFTVSAPIPLDRIKSSLINNRFEAHANLNAWYELYGVKLA